MGKILYVTNCAGGGMSSWQSCKNRSSPWAYNTRSKGDIVYPESINHNLAHFLIQEGHEVSVYTQEAERLSESQAQAMMKMFFHKDAKAHKNKDLDLWTKLLYSRESLTNELFPWVNLLIMQELSEVAGFENFDMVLYDSFFEYVCLTRKNWRSIFRSCSILKSGIPRVIKDIISVEEIFAWIDSPGHTAETKCLGNYKPLLPPKHIHKLSSALFDIKNFYIVNDPVSCSARNLNLLSATGAENVEKTIDTFFPKTDCGKYRFHAHQFIPIDAFDNLTQIINARQLKKIDKTELFKGFESAMMQCPETLPHFKMCERKIPFQKEINASNYVDYFYGVSRITDTGYKEQAANITKMLSELSVVS